MFAVLGLLVTLVAVPAGTAFACSCAPFEAKRAVGEADTVLLGTAVDVRAPGALGDDVVTARVRADHVYKGRADAGAAELEVVTASDSAACGYPFERGARYLLFANAEEGRLATTLCSGNIEVPDTGRPLLVSDIQDRTQGAAELIAALGEARPVSAPEPERGPDIVGFLLMITPAAAVAAVIVWLRLRRRGEE